ncbi:MAG: geranylgeranyl reductase family protein [Thermoleophilia bacterium]|nr:geranylgeranyl reductase family protein [Thermoleophilia bacterium]
MKAAGSQDRGHGLYGEGRRSNCEVLVIGAGPAGGAAALAAAQAGADVIVIDRRQRIGIPVRCAGFLPAAAISAASLPDGVISQKIRSMLSITPDGHSEECSSPGFMVRRERLDQALIAAASAAGARVFTGVRAISREPVQNLIPGVRSHVRVGLAGGSRQIEAGIIIGADGPLSAAGAWTGNVNSAFLTAAQWTVPLRDESTTIRIYFDRRLPGGYGWLFPRGKEAVAGVGVETRFGEKPSRALKWFVSGLAAEGLIRKHPISATAGLIPVGGILANRSKELLLAGDAAGLCHPLTGAGIGPALLSGRLAGEAAAAHIRGNPGALTLYSREIESMMGDALREATLNRRQMYRNSGGSVSEFCETVRQYWFGFSRNILDKT